MTVKNLINQNKMKHYILAAFLLAAIQGTSFSQSMIAGTIRSIENDQTIPGVNVLIKGTVMGTISDDQGAFEINDLEPGEYVLQFSHIGYDIEERTIQVYEGREMDLNIALVPRTINLASVHVEWQRPFTAASSKAIREFDLKTRPARTSQDLLMLVPGLYIAQHAGGGKAEQIFMRGFDADHGTDVGIDVDGIPVNMVSHGHGQGYADLHFLIPELVDGMTVYKGPYFAPFGNFGTAGSVTFRTIDHPEHNLVKVEGGMFSTAKLTSILKIPVPGAQQSAYLAGQFGTTNGPFESPQGFNRFNLFGKFHTHINNESALRFTIGAFSSAWDASGQIPERAVENGYITRWGGIDDLEGGTTGRYNASLDYIFKRGVDRDFQLQAYVSKYDFKLFSNFTFFLNDSINGDMIEQADYRTIYGINAKYSIRQTIGSVVSITKAGGQFRIDDIDLQLWHSPDRIRKSARSQSDVLENNAALWLEQDFIFNEKWKLQLGLRGDYFTFNVNDHMDILPADSTELPHASGYAQEGILSPKINLVFTPVPSVDLFLNAGSGFHSNDARNIIIAERMGSLVSKYREEGLSETEIEEKLLSQNFDPEKVNIKTLPRAVGAEMGAKIQWTPNILFLISTWYLRLEEELVFVGDEGTTEISGATERYGLDFEGRFQFTNWLWADVDLNLARAFYVNEPNGANYVPLAPRFTSQGGLNMQLPSGLSMSVRYRYVGDRPANEDNTVTALGHFIPSIYASYQLGKIRFFAQVENIFNAEWNEAQFDTESRLSFETGPVSELHYTPGNPVNLQTGISIIF
jgi:hypothetical protein